MADLIKLTKLNKYGEPIPGTDYAYGFSYILKANSYELMYSYSLQGFIENSYPIYTAPEIFKSSETEHGDEGFIEANYTNTPGLNDIINKLNDIIFDVNMLHYKNQMYMDPKLSITVFGENAGNKYIDLNSNVKSRFIEVNRLSTTPLNIKILDKYDNTDYSSYFTISSVLNDIYSTKSQYEIIAKDNCPLHKYRILVNSPQQDGSDMYEGTNAIYSYNYVIKTQKVTNPYVIRNIATRALKDEQGNSRDYMFKDGSFTNSEAGNFIYSLSYISEEGITYTANNLKFSDIICYTTGKYNLTFGYELGEDYNVTCEPYKSGIIGELNSELIESPLYITNANIYRTIFNNSGYNEKIDNYNIVIDVFNLPYPGFYNDSKMELFFNYFEKDLKKYKNQLNGLNNLANSFLSNVNANISFWFEDENNNLSNTFMFENRLTYISQCFTLLDENENELQNIGEIDNKCYVINFSKASNENFYDESKNILKFKINKFKIVFELTYLNIFRKIANKNLVLKFNMIDTTYENGSLAEPTFFYNFELPINFKYNTPADNEMFYVAKKVTTYSNTDTYNAFIRNYFCSCDNKNIQQKNGFTEYSYDEDIGNGKLTWNSDYYYNNNLYYLIVNMGIVEKDDFLYKIHFRRFFDGFWNALTFSHNLTSLNTLLLPSYIIHNIQFELGLAFKHCSNIENIYIYFIDDDNNLFYKIKYFSSIFDNETKKYKYYNCVICDNDFMDTKSLILGCKNTIIPNDIPNLIIGEYAFYKKFMNSDINIPDNVISIKDYAFQECTGLTKLNFENHQLNSIGTGAFSNCDNLCEIILNNNFTKIMDETFNSCVSLKKIVIPDSVITIGNSAFNQCSNLTEITLGSSIKSIGKSGFEWCKNLTFINIPDSVETIGKQAFYCCNLSKIIIGQNIKSIGDYAFNNFLIYKLDVYIYNDTPPELGTEVFPNYGGSIFGTIYTKIYVPEKSLTNYQNANGWKEYHIFAME